jgi:hypothetical protein
MGNWGIAPPFLTSPLDGGTWWASRLSLWYPLNRSLGVWRRTKSLASAGNRTPAVQPLACNPSLYQRRCPGSCICVIEIIDAQVSARPPVKIYILVCCNAYARLQLLCRKVLTFIHYAPSSIWNRDPISEQSEIMATLHRAVTAFPAFVIDAVISSFRQLKANVKLSV